MNTHKVSFYMQLDEYDEGINYYVSPRRGIRFVFDPVSDLSLSLSLLFGITRQLLERE